MRILPGFPALNNVQLETLVRAVNTVNNGIKLGIRCIAMIADKNFSITNHKFAPKARRAETPGASI